MRIGIEAQRVFRKKKHGMDIVVLEIIKALQTIDFDNEYFIFVKKGEDNTCLQETKNFKIIEVPGITYADWEQIYLPQYARKNQIDILHCTSNTAPVFFGGKTIVTLHDVIFLEQSKQASTMSWYQNLGRIYRKWVVPSVIRKADHIITVSEYERKRIAEILALPLQKISVVYNAFGKHFHNRISQETISQIKERYKLPASYIFYIGNTDPKKNIFNTLLAYKHYCAQVNDPRHLVIADIQPEFLDMVLEKTETRGLRKLIVLTDYIMNADLPCIYAGADVFLYPSLRESFGIPLLESMACGTPVITSNNSALPEVAGNAALLIDASNPGNIGDALIHILENKVVADEFIQKGLARIQEFSWVLSAQKLLTIYKAV